MWTLIDVLYQEYCRAGLAEMRRVIRWAITAPRKGAPALVRFSSSTSAARVAVRAGVKRSGVTLGVLPTPVRITIVIRTWLVIVRCRLVVDRRPKRCVGKTRSGI
jgi:hypothetical protein